LKESPRLHAALVAFAFVALHLPFLPASLEDLDSINFALGLREFDVAEHQPHPPGYPVFVVLAKAAQAFVSSEAHALSLIGVLAGGLAVYGLMRFLGSLAGSGRIALAATILAATSPLFWMTASRPLSDVAGLAAAIAVQAAVLRARDPRGLAAAAAAAAIGVGIRSQVAWLTVPMLILGIARQNRSERWRAASLVSAGYLAGVLIWAVPLIVLSGGPSEYLRVLFSQGAEDFSGVVMLWTTPTPRQLVRTVENTLIAPWGGVASAVIVLAFAGIGLGLMARREASALGILTVAFGPYLAFHSLFQETATTRYALPLVIPVSYAAARAAAALPARIGTTFIVAIVAYHSFISTQALNRYASVPAPAFRMLEDMRESARERAPVLAMHRRDEFDFRRPIRWVGLPAIDRRLPSPPKHEWLEVVNYWNAGGRQPVWFVADPPRSDLALFKHQRAPVRYRWPFGIPSVMGGARPNEMDWYVFEPPDWFLGEGWAITPETAGVAREDGRSPGRGGIRGWIRRWPAAATLMVGGRNLNSAGPNARVTIEIDGRPIDELTVSPGFFLKMIALPAGRLAGAGDYATLTVRAESIAPRPDPDVVDVAIEQFDAQPDGRVIFGYGEGWNELEYNPATGRLWRWSGERAAVHVLSGGRALTLRMDGEIEAASSSRVTIRAGDRVVAEQDVGRRFSLSVPLPSGLLSDPGTSVVIETSAWYIPANDRWRSRDQRQLGLKIYSFQLVPAS
jgi:hypothetical protein